MAGRPKGTPKTGGRKPGSHNKKTVELREELDRFLSLNKLDHPVLALVKIGHGLTTWPVVVRMKTADGSTVNMIEKVPATPELRVTCLKAAAEYMDPKLSALRYVDKAGNDVPPPVVAWSSLGSDGFVRDFVRAHPDAGRRAEIKPGRPAAHAGAKGSRSGARRATSARKRPPRPRL